ncbi:DUF4948 family protein [Porphyromonas gingivicanis]|nr:DUF4948 family protein [Porphyromonas gingivicanis]
MFKPLNIVSIVFVFLMIGCRKEIAMPSDNSMLNSFNLHEATFEELKDISVKYHNFHYPPYDEKDSVISMISSEHQKQLDTLLQKIKVSRIITTDTTEVRLLLHTWGLSISGGYKEYLYSSKLVDNLKRYNEECILNPDLEKFLIKRITMEDLNQVAQRYSTNLELYRPIKGSWYIHLCREN